MNTSTVETLIGGAVILVAAVFFGYAYNASGAGGRPGGYSLTAEFDNVEGVNVGTDVRMAGIKIGTVTAQALNTENFQAVVTMSIDPFVKLKEDTTAKVTAEGLLGAKFIALDAGGSDTILADGGVITSTQGAVDIWSLISQAMFERTGAKDPSQPAPEPQAQ
ncbi:MAG: outer membrane lipid asymmetry maintenance protein MlaD [Rhizobiales bacterium]|nr:outer membrane lipid asymmetry maintenance protein MlaD [Hyphomicrobiales bacterium]